MKILLTGMAGFIGYHTVLKLREKHEITGIDNLNAYYDIKLKTGRLKNLGFGEPMGNGEKLSGPHGLKFVKLDLSDRDAILNLFRDEKFDIVLHFGAQAGVRYSLEQPFSYIDSNITGFLTVLEACRKYPVKHLFYASSSSVYGCNEKTPYNEEDRVDHPVSLYAASKRADEIMAEAYSHLYEIPRTGLRFFTVYGPWGRPDMAYYKFTENIISGRPIEIYNHGKMERDFTYIDDIVNWIDCLANLTGTPGLLKYPVLNLGNNKPVGLADFVDTIEDLTGKKAEKIMKPMQPGDVVKTCADITRITTLTGYSPRTDIRTGLKKFMEWFLSYKD